MVVVGERRLSGEQDKPGLINLAADPQAINVGKICERIQVEVARSVGNPSAQLNLSMPLRKLRTSSMRVCASRAVVDSP